MNQNQVELEELLGGASDYEVLSHYNGEVELEYSHSLHAYTVVEDGVRKLVPGVTSVVAMIDKSGPLTQWAANMTVEWFIEHYPIPQVISQLRADYEKFRNKLPWEDEILPGTLCISATNTKDIAKLLNDARFNYRQISKDATDVGHQAHEWLEHYIKRKLGIKHQYTDRYPALTDERAKNCVKAALKWFSKHQFKPIFSEKKLYSREYGYAGTCDWLAHVTSCGDSACCPFEGEALVLGDFKSSRSLYDEYLCQLSSYWHAIEEEFPDLKIDVCTLLRLGKEDGEFEVRTTTREEFEEDFDGFLACLQMYCWQKQRWLTAKFDKEQRKATEKAEKELAKAEAKEAKAQAKADAKAEKERIKAEEKAAKALAKAARVKVPRRTRVKKAVVPGVELAGIEIEESPTGRTPSMPNIQIIPIEGEAA